MRNNDCRQDPYGRLLWRLVRYMAAFVILVYGFAKLNGSQFTILDSELDKPMGRVSGFWLTWYYFGYSPVYGNFLGLAEIVSAVLLTFQRTTLLGACILAPMLGNIVLIDVCYGVDPGATIVAMALFIATVSLVSVQRRQLLAIFWPRAENESAAFSWRKLVVRAAMVCVAFGFTYWAANYNNRMPTPIDGAWDVVQVEPASIGIEMPATIYFEYNRAFMAVFRLQDGSFATHRFELDTKAKTLRLWKQWLAKGELIFSGTYALSSSELNLDGELNGSGHAALRLHRRIIR